MKAIERDFCQEKIKIKYKLLLENLLSADYVIIIADSLQEIIVPLLRKCAEQSYRIGDETLTAVAKNLGSWCYNLREVLSPQDRAWFLSMYTRLAGVDESQQQPANRARQGPLPIMTQSDPEGLSLLEPAGAEDSGHVACRRMCAYNFPVSCINSYCKKI